MSPLFPVLSLPAAGPAFVLTWGQNLWTASLSMLPVLLLIAVVWLAVAQLRLRSEVAELRRQVTAVRLDRGYLIEPGTDPELAPATDDGPVADVVGEDEHPPRLAGI